MISYILPSPNLLLDRNILFLASFYKLSPLLFLFLSITLFSGCRFLEEPSVSVTRAVLHPTSSTLSIKSVGSLENRDLLMQASGWIEPDPYPIRLPALYDGIVSEVYILEGEEVKPGQRLVSLINEDAQLSLRMAIAELEKAKSMELEIVSELSLEKFALEKADFEKLQAQALLDEHEDYLKRLETLPTGSISPFDLNRSRYTTNSKRFSLDATLSNINFSKERLTLLTHKLRSQKQVTEMKAIQVEKAKLDLNRTEIYSPINGRVLKLFTSPGKRLMQNMDAPDASTAVILYKDEKLQARIDVPLADAAKLISGQKVEITCSMLPNMKFDGRLTRISGEADLQRNTLQVKVQILNPDKRLRPEMLCRAKFFSKSETLSDSQNKDRLGVFIPLFLKPENNQSKANLWIIGKEGNRAEIREVELGDEIISDYISVKSGIQAGDLIITNPPNSLQSGDSVKVLRNP